MAAASTKVWEQVRQKSYSNADGTKLEKIKSNIVSETGCICTQLHDAFDAHFQELANEADTVTDKVFKEMDADESGYVSSEEFLASFDMAIKETCNFVEHTEHIKQ